MFDFALSRLLSVGVGDLADKLGLAHVHGSVHLAGLRSRIIPEDFHHQSCCILFNVCSKCASELCPIEEKIAVLRRQNRRHGRTECRIRNQRRYRFSFIRRECCNVNKTRNLGMSSRLCYYGPALGMPHENNLAA